MNPRCALIASTLLALTACGESGPADFDDRALADVIDDTLDDAEFDDDSTAELRRCPVDDWDDIVEDAVASLDDEIVEVALDGDRQTNGYDDESGEFIDCSFFVDGNSPAGAGLFMLEAPSDADDYAEEFAGDGTTVDIDETGEYRGGVVRHVCVEFDDDTEPYCQVEWLGDDALIGVYVFGADADRIDVDDLQAGFEPQLDLIFEQFAA